VLFHLFPIVHINTVLSLLTRTVTLPRRTLLKQKGATVFIVAAQYGYEAVVRLLLEYRADSSVADQVHIRVVGPIISVPPISQLENPPRTWLEVVLVVVHLI
jgi:hypothetical protein